MRRRLFLQSVGASPLAALRPGPEARRISVRDLEVFPVRVNARGNWILTRIRTSAGLTGIGDASHGGSDPLKIELMRRFFELLKGRSVFEVEWLRGVAAPEIAKHGSAAAIALSGIEQCLWDIQGKAFGVPSSELFGGRLRSRLRNYANINRSAEERSPDGFARMAEKAVEAGFDAVKLAPFDDLPRALTDAARIEELTTLGIARAAAVRRAIGPARDLLVDAHSRFDLHRGLALARRLEPLNLFWLEEVTPAQPPGDLAAINRAAKMPTAGGEAIYGVSGFLPYIAAGAVDIVMPDVKYCGGMLEMKKIAAMAEAAGLPVAPHGPASPVGNVAAGHVCVTLPNFQILEYSFGEVPWRAALIDPPEALDKGYLAISDRPGLGIALNDKTVAAHLA